MRTVTVAEQEARGAAIEAAAQALESGRAATPDGQDPQSMADMLRTAHERGSLGAFAAYKTAQRITQSSKEV